MLVLPARLRLQERSAGVARGLFRAVVPCLLLATGGEARADSAQETFHFDWSAPSPCSRREQVLEQVALSIGPNAKLPPISVRVVLEPLPGGRWSVVLIAEGGTESGRRQFEVESCDAAATATALILRLMIDPAHGQPEALAGVVQGAIGGPPVTALPPPAPPPPPPPALPPPVVPPVPLQLASTTLRLAPPVAPSSAAPARSRFDLGSLLRHFSGRLALAGDLGTLARADLGGELALAFSASHFHLEVAGSDWVTSQASSAELPGEGTSLELLTLAVRGGYGWALGPFRLTTLVGLEVESLTGTGFGGTTHSRQEVAFGAASLGGSAAWPLGRFLSVVLAAEAVAPFVRPGFLASESAPVVNIVLHRVSAVDGRASLGVEARFF